jgi:hypothetical protein
VIDGSLPNTRERIEFGCGVDDALDELGRRRCIGLAKQLGGSIDPVPATFLQGRDLHFIGLYSGLAGFDGCTKVLVIGLALFQGGEFVAKPLVQFVLRQQQFDLGHNVGNA